MCVVSPDAVKPHIKHSWIFWICFTNSFLEKNLIWQYSHNQRKDISIYNDYTEFIQSIGEKYAQEGFVSKGR